MPPKFDVEGFLAALRDVRVAEALNQMLLPGIQDAIQSAIDNVIGELKTRITEQSDCISRLKADNENLRNRIGDLETYNRIDNVVVYGLPESFAEAATAADSASVGTEDEGPSRVTSEQQFVELCQTKLQMGISASDICTAHRLPRKPGGSARGPRPMIVRFNNRNVRARVMAAKKILRQDSSCRIFINEHLTQSASELFAASRALQRIRKLSQTWTYNGRVYVRVTDGPSSRPILIKSLQQLESLA